MPGSASEIPRPARWAARAAAALLAALAVASCTSVLSLDGYQNAPEAICGLLDQCYAEGAPAGCRAHVNRRVGDAEWTAVSDWFRSVSANGCLETCTSARKCMDSAPVCFPPQQPPAPCDAGEDCCGYASGAADCHHGRCCATAGHHCSADQDCCGIACDTKTNTCGGTQCRDPGVACTLDDECCSHSCRGRACADSACNPEGFDCKGASDCCDGSCTAGKCGKPACGLAGTVCKSGGDCCDGLQCFQPAGGPVGICSTGQCLPEQADCSPTPDPQDDPCCEGMHCDPTYFKCSKGCVKDTANCDPDVPCCSGSACGSDGTCPTACSKAYCDPAKQGKDCCTGTCIAGTCAPECQKPQVCMSHSVCVIGDPLSNAPACVSQGDCISTICATDPYCCCTGWDAFCVQEAIKHANICASLCILGG